MAPISPEAELAPMKSGKAYDSVESEDPEAGASDVALQEKPVPTVPMHRLFKFRDEWDTAAMVAACLFAFLQGCSMPLFTIILGDATDAMGGEEDGKYSDEMREPLRLMGYLMCFMFVTASTHAALLDWASQRQGARLRLAYLEAALARDQAWYRVGKVGVHYHFNFF